MKKIKQEKRLSFTSKSERFNREAILTIRSLKKENRILKAEIKRLSLLTRSDLRRESSREMPENKASKIWLQNEKEASYLTSGSYIKYLISKITGGSFYAFSKRIYEYFKKFRLISTIMRVTSSILTILGTGAFFIFISSAIVFIIPIILITAIAVYILGSASRASAFKKIRSACKKNNIYVFFPQKDKPFGEDSYFRKTLKDISNDTNKSNFIIVVSPYFLSSAGFSDGKEKFYSIARFESERICIVRQHAFFLLRRRVLQTSESKTIYIY